MRPCGDKARASKLRGYFGIGAEGLSKAGNLGSLFRTAHAFGASFVFTVAADFDRDQAARVDTSDTPGSLPYFEFPDLARLRLPRDCELVGIELMDDAVELPSFRHPRAAAYVLGPERGSLSPAMVAMCSHVVKIPTRFSINLGLAGALVMYDRLVSVGRFAGRPVSPGGPVVPLDPTTFGPPKFRRRKPA
jgi:tRNA G18 (ribose-2'-O)-methylase SpoU